MKKTILSLLLASVSVLSNAQTTIANNSFENWYNFAVKDSLDHWRTSTQQYQESGSLEINNTYQINDAYAGTSAVHLETILYYDEGTMQNDTAFGYIVKENADDMGFQGFPYSDTVDVFKCWYRCGIESGDMALIIIELKKNGTVYASATFPVTGNMASWTELTVPIIGGAAEEPDSVFIGVASSDPFTPGVATPGSWIEIDEMSFEFNAGSVVPSPIPNGGFENWTYETISLPQSWYTFDQLVYNMVDVQGATQSSDAAHGNFSLQLETTFEYAMLTFPVIATNGYFDQTVDSIVGGSPFYAQPDQIGGAYQFLPTFDDTAWVYVDFWNSGSGNHTLYIDTLLETSDWTNWSIDLDFTEAPDSVLIVFWGGQVPGSVLLLDNIHFTGGDLKIENEKSNKEVSIYPNPAQEFITISNTSWQVIRMFDASGKMIYLNSNNENYNLVISLEDFENGTYMVQIVSDGKIQTEKLIISK